MARLSEKGWFGWTATGRKKRADRHDLEDIADRPSTGKVRGRKRGRCRDGHDFQHSHNRSYGRTTYSISRCTRCGKDDWTRTYHIPLSPVVVKMADEKFFPIHEPGTCPVCDERRKGG